MRTDSDEENLVRWRPVIESGGRFIFGMEHCSENRGRDRKKGFPGEAGLLVSQRREDGCSSGDLTRKSLRSPGDLVLGVLRAGRRTT